MPMVLCPGVTGYWNWRCTL